MKRIYIDLETTGLFEYKNGITQIAARVEIHDVVVATRDFRAKPFPTDVIETKALEVQGRSEAEIMTYPEPMEVMQQFSRFLGQYVNKYDTNDKFVFVGYNVDFDERFLRKFFTKCGDKFFGSWFWTPSICCMRLAMHHLQSHRADLPNFKLETVCTALGLTSDIGEGMHDAATDIDLTYQLYKLICKHTVWE